MCLKISKFLWVLFFIQILLLGCTFSDPDVIKKDVNLLKCDEILFIEMIRYLDGREVKYLISEEGLKCNIINNLKVIVNKPHNDYLPTNQNIESFYVYLYNLEGKVIFEIQSGIMSPESGYLYIISSKERGILDTRLISDIKFPKEMLSIFENRSDSTLDQ